MTRVCDTGAVTGDAAGVKAPAVKQRGQYVCPAEVRLKATPGEHVGVLQL
jgi:hypothetical protein